MLSIACGRTSSGHDFPKLVGRTEQALADDSENAFSRVAGTISGSVIHLERLKVR